MKTPSNLTQEATIQLPKEVEELLSRTIFDIDDNVDTDYLNKYLFYMPEVIRLFGLAIAEIKREVSMLEIQLDGIKNTKLMGIASEINSFQFKNEQMRTAFVESDPTFRKTKEKIVEKVFEIDNLTEEVRKYKNLLLALDNISKLKISERRY